VLTALHADPARPWTIESLADEVAVSRATLARRFPALVGDTPAAYLARWRMDLAARRLRDSDDPVNMVARAAGYTSEYAFSRAFSRSRAVPPGRYRRWSRTAASH
jgi:transcriptional regulator GlxA family with amidase domain